MTRPVVLQRWLIHHNALCLWSQPGPRDTRIELMEAYGIGKGIVIVQIYMGGTGWDLFTAHHANEIVSTLADAEERLQVPEADRMKVEIESC